IYSHAVEFILPNEPDVPEQIVITDKTSQSKDVRAAVGSRYGEILPAEGHLFDCLSQRMLCRPGSGGRRYFCVPKVSTTLAPQREGTKPPSSKPFARHSAAPNEFGSLPIAIAKVSSSVRKFSSIT